MSGRTVRGDASAGRSRHHEHGTDRQGLTRLRAHPDDGAVHRDQGGESGFAAFLPHGRFLRTLLRRCREGFAGAGHRADQARQAQWRGYSDVRRAGACGGRLSAEADRPGFPRRGVRTDRRPRGGEKARRQIGGEARCHPSGDAGYHHRGQAAGSLRGQFPHGAGPCQRFAGGRLRSGLDRHLHGFVSGRRNQRGSPACRYLPRRSA